MTNPCNAQSRFHIRRALLADEPVIREFFRASTREDRAEKRTASRLGPYDPAAEKGALAETAMPNGRHQVLLITERSGGRIIGYGRAYHRRQDPHTTLHKLYVAKDARGHGAARLLINEFAHTARAIGQRAMAVTLSTPEIEAFYRHLGFDFWTEKASPRVGRPPLRIFRMML